MRGCIWSQIQPFLFYEAFDDGTALPYGCAYSARPALMKVIFTVKMVNTNISGRSDFVVSLHREGAGCACSALHRA